MAADQERRRRNAGAGILYALVEFRRPRCVGGSLSLQVWRHYDPPDLSLVAALNRTKRRDLGDIGILSFDGDRSFYTSTRENGRCIYLLMK